MKIVTIYPGHNATVGLYENGKCKLILHEEKFSNLKHHLGFPLLSFKFLSKQFDFSKVDYFLFCSKTYLSLSSPAITKNIVANLSSRQSISRKIFDYIDYKLGLKGISDGLRNISLHAQTSIVKEQIKRWLMRQYQISENKCIYIDHHLSHCLSPVYFFNLQKEREKILLISMDGFGDFSFAKIYIYDPKNNTYERIVDNNYRASLGALYMEMTRFLGMKPLEHEYKVMGLAAYVSSRRYYDHLYEKLSKIVWLNKKTLTFESKFNTNISFLYFKDNFSGERFDNLAAAIQSFLENLVIQWIKTTIRKTGINTIAVSGGVFMNVKMNQKILELKEVRKIYIQPSAGDESLGIGAAAKLFLDNKIKLKPISSMYLGTSYTNQQIEKFLINNNCFKRYSIKFIEDIEKEIAYLLANFKIVGRFKGKGEWGARSLCNRAILGNASDLKTFYKINDMIKMRDFWMPFAPTILKEWMDKYIKNSNMIKRKAYESTKYMIIALDSTDLAQKHLRAAIHQKDKTLRPQIIDKKDNNNAYKLLKYFEDFAGMGGILNTSLNLHGFPLAGTLKQALSTFENSGLQYLAIENFLIKKIK